MIEVRSSGDIFLSGAHVLVNPINCHGVMGAGLAKEFARRFPTMLAEYHRLCRFGLIQVGHIFVWRNATQPQREDGKEGGMLPEIIFNFPTKNAWRDPSKLDYIEAGIEDLGRKLIIESFRYKNKTIALPALGCGLGGLTWEEVYPLIASKLSICNENTFLVYKPQ